MLCHGHLFFLSLCVRFRVNWKVFLVWWHRFHPVVQKQFLLNIHGKNLKYFRMLFQKNTQTNTYDIVDIKISNNGIFFLLTTNVLLLRKAWKHVSDAHILFCYMFLFAKSFLRMLNEAISKIKTNLTSTKSLLFLAVWCLCF